MSTFSISAATTEHIDELRALAAHLNTVNLPDDRDALLQLLQTSEASFAGAIDDPTRREYVFLLRDLGSGRAVGTSSIIAQLGRRDAPYIYFDVRREEKYSDSLDRHFIHTLLQTTYCYDGPTELGGLVVHPDYRGHPDKLGRLISMVRLLYIAMRRADFQAELLAELMPPLEPDGYSHLWAAVGSRFTGLTYREADLLSRRNKEFIRSLFPDVIYATLLSDVAQAVIGQVGVQTRPVERLLTRLGFTYAYRVDPFDGGPHFTCPTDRCAPITRLGTPSYATDLPAGPARPGLLGRLTDHPPYFAAYPAELRGSDAAPMVEATLAPPRPAGPAPLERVIPLD